MDSPLSTGELLSVLRASHPVPNAMIWDRQFKKVVEISDIGIFRKGLSQSNNNSYNFTF